MTVVTENRVRPVSVSDLGIDIQDADISEPSEAEATVETSLQRRKVPKLDRSHPMMVNIQAALDMEFAGVILAGPPGTGKSYYAERVAHTLAEDPEAVTTIQFHASYQYEDFMQGFAPSEKEGFILEDKTFVLACKAAISRSTVKHVIVIDEISRCDVARVFGEALTYLELDKRGKVFTLASGDELAVPPNLIILATMNPWDKGVDELDVALERRFAQIDVLPDADALRSILKDNGADAKFAESMVRFFTEVQRLDNEQVRLGHAYFSKCTDRERAERLWAYRLKPFFAKACRLDKAMFSSIQRKWLAALNVAEEAPTGAEDVPAAVSEDVTQPSAEEPTGNS